MMLDAAYGRILEPYRFPKLDKIKLSVAFADLQRRIIGHTREFVKKGMPDFGPETNLHYMDDWVSKRYFEKLSTMGVYSEAAQIIKRIMQSVRENVCVLVKSGIPAAVSHNDLFFSNVYKRDGTGDFVFFDCVEACIGHPFIAYLSGLDEDAYLDVGQKTEVWLNFYPVLQVGKRVRQFMVFCLRNLEAEVMEEPEASASLKCSRNMLLGMYHCYA